MQTTEDKRLPVRRTIAGLRVRTIAFAAGLCTAAVATALVATGQNISTFKLTALSSEPLYAAGAGENPTLTLALSVEFPTVPALRRQRLRCTDQRLCRQLDAEPRAQRRASGHRIQADPPSHPRIHRPRPHLHADERHGWHLFGDQHELILAHLAPTMIAPSCRQPRFLPIWSRPWPPLAAAGVARLPIRALAACWWMGTTM